jgi:hypothetical protein
MIISTISTAAAVLYSAVVTAASEPCSVYLAKASSDDAMIPVSMYAGVDFSINVTIGNPEMGIHLSDLQENIKGIKPPFNHIILDYFWTPSEIASQFEDTSADLGMTLLSGMGFAGSTSPGLFNTRWNHSVPYNRYRMHPTSALDWRKDPMACAVSDFFNLQLRTTTAIKAGSEIFPFFGDSWLEGKEESIKNDPNSFSQKNFEKAEEIISQYAALLVKHKNFFTAERAQDYWDLIVNDVIQDEKVRKLLPASYTEVTNLVGKPLISSQHPNIERSLNYLMSHGTCMDNLVQGATSTIPGAGRGAFAKRAIANGDVVAGAPLIRMYRQHMPIYAMNESTKTKTEELDGEQLVINYVLGHPKSPFVFYPYGTGINFINHATHGQLVPNVKFVWSEKDYHDSKYLKMDIDAIEEEEISPFVHVMDVVATRDILEGEEILLDYGESFDQALNRFIEEYQASISEYSSGDASAAVLNAINEPFRTMKEQDASPYPEDIAVVCYYDDDASAPVSDASSFKTPNLEELGIDASSTTFFSYADSVDGVETMCDVLHVDLDQEEPTYLVRVRLSDVGNYAYVVDVPHSAILFLDKPYSSPAQGAGAFRHYIEIPDDVFPKTWMVANE